VSKTSAASLETTSTSGATADAASADMDAQAERRQSARRESDRKLIETREFLDAIMESVPAMLLVKDAGDGKCILLNRAGEELLGCDRGEIVGRDANEIMSKQDADLIALQDRQALLSGTPYETHEHQLKTRNRGARLVRTKRVPVRDATGEAKYVLSFTEDVTQQRQIEEQLRHAQKMEALGELTGGLAHDFNNLLAIVIGNLDILKEIGTGDSAKDALVADAMAAALSGSELTKRLLAFARRQPLQPERIDLNELIGGISKLLARTLGADVEITLDLDATIAPIVADRAQLETTIANLANNARDAMPGGGHLTIATRHALLDQAYAAQHAEVEPGNYVAMEVSDTGQGMPPDVLSRIFEPFYTTKGLGKGTGLGLSMVFGFVKQSGGHINVYSEPGRGTTFRLYFPPTEAGVEALAEAPPLQPAQGRGETILVVEDSGMLRQVVVKQLMSLGFNVLNVADARAALDLLATRGSVDLLFTDVVLPGEMDGCALAREVLARYPGSKVLLTSGYPGARIADTVGSGGGLRLISKPYRKEELMRMLREVLDERG
jgi:PAS domain S-box-containing protein